jgi:hypothetical protein
MKRIVVQLSGMPFDPTYEIDDDTIAIGDIVRVPGSGSAFIQDGETGTVIALESPYTGHLADLVVISANPDGPRFGKSLGPEPGL